MKKVFILTILFVFAATQAFAAEFSPTQLKLSAQEMIQYDFDGSALSIPLTVSGTPATVIFSVYTKNMADNITAVKNGYLV